jgi:hypothetical protein
MRPPPRPSRPQQEARPAQGVYAYATTGSEEVDVLGGSSHTYPDTTYVTLRHSACGFDVRWQPLEERWDDTSLCASDGRTEIRRYTMYHEFFQRGVEERFDCEPGAMRVFDRSAAAGATWMGRCEGEQSRIDMAVRVVGAETLDVGGTPVQAVRMHYDGRMSGANNGTQVQERWIDPRTALLLRMTSVVEGVVTSPLGQSNYAERYELRLTSLQPRT